MVVVQKPGIGGFQTPSTFDVDLVGAINQNITDRRIAQKLVQGTIPEDLVHEEEGAKAARITCPPKGRWTGFNVRRDLLARWGDYDYFTFDVFNPYEKDVQIFVRIDDDKSKQSDYSTQYGRRFKLRPGENQVKIKLSRMPNQVQPWLQRKLNPNTLKLVAIW